MAAAVTAQLPLGLAGEDQLVYVARVKGDAELRQHLAELGFVDGAEVKVISSAQGNVIVNVKGARLALNRTMANHVTVAL